MNSPERLSDPTMNPERRVLDIERAEQFSQRATRVVERYISDHPDSVISRKYADGGLTMEDAYRLMKELSQDPKTGVARPDLLHYTLEFSMEDSIDHQRATSIIVFDIDDFKNINTELGHVEADKILRQVAEIMKTSIRDSDDVVPYEDGDESEAVVRWGGEEFMIILSGANSQQAALVAERIRARVATELTELRPKNQEVTVSGGLAEYDHEAMGDDWQSWVELADKRMLQAKAAGKNQIHSVDHVLDELA